jgi:RNA polymerase sigma factor (sigma-70 family)
VGGVIFPALIFFCTRGAVSGQYGGMNRVLNRFYDQFTDTGSSTDRHLLERFLVARDEAAFAELVRRYGPLVWGACRRQLANHQDAEDAFQATFLVLVRRADQLTGDAPLGPWLYRVAVLTARRVTRGNRRRAPVTGPMEYELPAPEPEPAVEHLDLDGALLALPERDRAPVVLCHLQGLTRREAAQRLGCPEGTLSARLNRALRRLRMRLGALAPVALTAGAVAVPAPVLAATARTATIYSTSTFAAAGVSPTVVGLTDGVLRMFWMKKLLTAVTAAVLALGAGALVLGPSGRSETVARATEAVAVPAPPAPQDEPGGLKKLEQRVAELEKHKALLDAAREDQKVGAQNREEAREEKKAAAEPTPKELQTASNNLKQLGLAFHNYGPSVGDKWADDLTDKDGRPLLSWRVALLPHLGAEALYKEFKLDEPWDSEHNKKLIKKMPKVYAPVRVKAKEGETFCQRFVGKGALFNERGSDYTIPTIPDGTSNTALVVEAGDPVIWTQPADLPFNLKGPLPKLGGLFDGEFHILLCDGSVSRFKKDYDVDEMRNVIRPDDGNVIDFKKLKK